MKPPYFRHLFLRFQQYNTDVERNHLILAPFAVFLNQDNQNYVEPDISVICNKDKLDENGCNGTVPFQTVLHIAIYLLISRIIEYSLSNVPSFNRIALGFTPVILKPIFSYNALARLFPSTNSSSICIIFLFSSAICINSWRNLVPIP